MVVTGERLNDWCGLKKVHMFELTPDQLEMLFTFIAVGFLAQLIDGALGMAFGVITSTLLVSVLGLPPARASASVHLVEVFTTAASGLSHAFHCNINWNLFARLAIPGMVGGVSGAYVLSNIDGQIARPFVMAYLAAIGLYLLWRAWNMERRSEHRAPRIVEPLGLGRRISRCCGRRWLGSYSNI